MATKNADNSEETGIYKAVEFEKFIETIETGQAAHWVAVADALGVDQDTITRWKKTPQAQEAIKKGIDHALQCMQQAGSRDWRMWEAKLKMLGLNPANKVDVGGELTLKTALVEFIGDDGSDSQNPNT